MEKIQVSLVSPVYNEADHIITFVEEAIKSLDDCCKNYEIILVNDASTDKTEELIEKLVRKNSRVKCISLIKNSGQHAATVIGLKASSGEFTFLMDSDLQVSPKELKSVFKQWQTQAEWDIISCFRTKRSESRVRKIGSKLMTFFINKISGTNLEDPGSSFLLIRRKALETICHYEIHSQNLQILMGMLDLKIKEHPVQYKYNSKSSYHLFELIELFFLAFLNFTTGRKTLIFLSFIGGGLICIGFIAMAFIIMRGMIMASPLPTNLLIFFTFLFLTGAQFTFLSILTLKLERINKNLEFKKQINTEPIMIKSKPGENEKDSSFSQ